MRLLAVLRGRACAGLLALTPAGLLAACFSPEGSDPVTAGTTGTSPGATTTTTAPGPTTEAGLSGTTTRPATPDVTTDVDPATTGTATTQSTDPSATGTLTSSIDTDTSGDPGTTAPESICGDGIHGVDEECEDGNLVDGDGCSASCKSEAGIRYVFLTGVAYTVGEFGGLAGADAACNARAQLAESAAPLKQRTFKAWLSADGQSASSRLTAFAGNYVLPGGTVVANGTAAFWSGPLLAPIDVQDDGKKAPPDKAKCADSPNEAVWTGTTMEGGNAEDQNCLNWTDPLSSAVYGAYGDTVSSWTACNVTNCDEAHRFYCIETG
ncbi:DUF4215 domain-containing protein [Nannocystis punicea]|uniref:DUF4215 domain-containing protein n=1 Tax=Nannocystis punicea TaxID=2995304 RepID=A0ABY7HFM0_9BACT|nr:DUF4215 domain-containing protein [Nannocystis poenicansa]WAS98084.1 DUF4215 domain-containing protein [Nannocystis poenicansa]